MTSIKDKIVKMIVLGNGRLVRHFHVVEAGIYGKRNKFHSRLKKQKNFAKTKVSIRRIN